MSNRRCNLCYFNDIKKFAARTGQVAETVPKPSPFFADGVDVFLHQPGELDMSEWNWMAWFAKIPRRCVC